MDVRKMIPYDLLAALGNHGTVASRLWMSLIFT
jgi:hypothetical protein